MKLYSGILLFVFCCVGSIEPALAQPYESGHQPLQLWDNEARENMPQWVSIWLAILMTTFALGLFFVRRHVEARWVVGGFIIDFQVCLGNRYQLGIAYFA